MTCDDTGVLTFYWIGYVTWLAACATTGAIIGLKIGNWLGGRREGD